MQLADFAKQLKKLGFAGEFSFDQGQCQVHATDNSIYTKLPMAVAYPKQESDVVLLVKLAEQFGYNLTAQGGSTATVGQSLTSGIIVDLSRHLNKIIDISLADNWVEVEAGCSLQILTKYLSEFERVFPVSISPADRATLGGMVATNAVGYAGACFGRTSANVLDLRVVTANADMIDTGVKNHKLQYFKIKPKTQIIIGKRAAALERNIGGYDLAQYLQTGRVAALFCGAEGTLGIVTKIKLKIITRPKKQLLLLQHKNIEEAIAVAVKFKGIFALELLDHGLAQAMRQQSSDFGLNLAELGVNEAIILVEHSDPEQIIAKIESKDWQVKIINNHDDAERIWQVRSQAVALASRHADKSGRRPLAFIEDTAVPKAQLAAYINELRIYLNKQKISYVMYGHIDAGCVHVRPAVNLVIDKELILEIINTVKQMCERYGGVFWGEHGVGYRSQFVTEYWGDAISEVMHGLKNMCDPKRIFNPGKIIAHDLVQISQDWRPNIARKNTPWLDCNGQAACLGNKDSVMCPSYRASNNKALSPKGRAQMLSYWHQGQGSDLLKSSLDQCLGCHACVSACPVAVNIPKAKAEYLNWFYQKYGRQIMSYFWANIERYLLPFVNFRHKPNKEVSGSVLIFTDMWTGGFDKKILIAATQVLRSLRISYEVMAPVLVGQSAFNEGDISGLKACIAKARTLKLANKPILVLDPSVCVFITSVWPDYGAVPIWHQQIQDVAAWLANQGVSCLIEPMKLFSHCSEQSLQPENIKAWQQIFQQRLELVQPGCCGMAGSFGLKWRNQKLARTLFSNWASLLSKQEQALATGFSCRLQAKRYGYKLMHPLEMLATKLGDVCDSEIIK